MHHWRTVGLGIRCRVASPQSPSPFLQPSWSLVNRESEKSCILSWLAVRKVLSQETFPAGTRQDALTNYPQSRATAQVFCLQKGRAGREKRRSGHRGGDPTAPPQPRDLFGLRPSGCRL